MTKNHENKTQANSPVWANMPLEQIKSESPSHFGVDQGLVFSLEYKGLMPPHAEEVKAGLTDNIVKEGKCRDKICVWRDTEQDHLVVLDGIARLEICREKNLPLPELIYIDLPDREACREWIIEAQLNRRNLMGLWVAYFRGLKYNSQKKEAHRPNAKELHQNDGVTVGETAQRLALEAGVSEATIERNARFAQSINQLKSDLGDEFGKMILNREFKNLSLVDINTLAEKTIGDKKAIANALIEEPELSLDEAEESIEPQEPDQSSDEINDDAATTSAETSNDTATSPSEVRQILNGIKSRHEADLTKLSNISVEFDATEDREAIPTMIETEREIITDAKDVIKAAKDTIAALEEIQRNSNTDHQ